MEIIAWVIIGIIGLIILGLVYYLLVGSIFFHYSLGRKDVSKRVKKKNLQKVIERYQIDLCWWDDKPFEKVKIQSFDGLTLTAHYLDQNSDKTVILVHGYGAIYKEMQPYAKFFFQKNFNILCVENRGHGESEGSCVGMGYLDRKDILGWIDFLNQKSKTKIVLFGISMGASAVCATAGENLPSNVVGIIADSPFDNVQRQLLHVLKKAGIFKKMILNHISAYTKRLHKYDIKEADIIKCVKKTKIPILYIHGKIDAFVPSENSQNLYNATPERLRDICFVEGADHVMSYVTLGVEYERKINNFFRKFKIFD